MSNLIIFILGAIAISCALPILQSIADLICASIEALRSKLSISIAKSTYTIAQLSIEDKSTNAIGFTINSNDDDEFIESEDKIAGFTRGDYR